MKKHLLKNLPAVLAVALLSMSVLVGCGGGVPESLEGTRWEVTQMSMNGVEMNLEEYLSAMGINEAMTIEFKDGKAVSNFMGQNQSTEYQFENGKLTLEGETADVNENTIRIESDGITLTLEKK